jgi:hypothetical protein
MRLANAAYEACPWRITSIAPDFKLLDAWGLDVEGSRGEFDAFVDTMTTLELAKNGPSAVRALFHLRAQLGRWFKWHDGGWDDGAIKLPIPGCTETTLGARLPQDLKNTVPVPGSGTSKFHPLYRTDNEWAAELSNKTVHAIQHLVWIDAGGGRYRGQLGVYVKPRGWLGSFYLALIGPFRRVIVYPAGIARIKSMWQARSDWQHH